MKTDQGAGELEQAHWQVRAALVVRAPPPAAQQPSERAFNHPAIAAEGLTGVDAAAARCRELDKWWAALWTIARVDGVEPTNNAAEWALRPAVQWRKGCFGFDSEQDPGPY